MTVIKTFFRVAPMAAAFALTLSGPAAAQVVPANPEADRISQEAVDLYGTPVRFREAADLHAQAAALRSANDPRRILDLEAAGRLFVYAGDAEEGRRHFELAARNALVMGDLARAGHRYIDAAFVAAKADDPDTARQMLLAARWIANAPMLQPGEERHLRRRMTAEDAN